MLKLKSTRHTPLWLLLTALLTGCAANSPLSPPVIAPPAIPALPDQARVSKVPIPSICSPSCLQGLTQLRESWQATLTESASPAKPASAATMP